MDHNLLNEILNIICKRDDDIMQDVLRERDHEQEMADAIEDVLRQAYRDGHQEGIVSERKFWMGKEDY